MINIELIAASLEEILEVRDAVMMEDAERLTAIEHIATGALLYIRSDGKIGTPLPQEGAAQ